MTKIITAAMLAIGDELLSGRTKDKNIGHLAECLTLCGIDLKEVRIVSDEQTAIVAALNALRPQYDYVFTSGGIGPTHDDITADAVAAAFGVGISHHEEAMRRLAENYAERDLEFTDARKRMARIPHGAKLIDNRVSIAPGFAMENVYVMAGVPSVFQAMVDEILPSLETGAKIHSTSIDCPFGEGTIGDELGNIQLQFPETSIGSYPRFNGTSFSTQIVIRSRDKEIIDNASVAINAMITRLHEIHS